MWASASSLVDQRGNNGAQDAAVVLEASAPFTQLVRLTLGVRVDDASPSAAAIVRAAIPPPGYGGEGLEGACDDDSEALAAAGALASRARSAALAHRMRAEVPEVADWCAALPEAQAPNTVQLLCPKANVGRLYKALSVAAPRLGATLGPVKAAISLDPMGHWPLCSALHSAAAAALDASGWAVLREGLAVERRLLDAPPGAHSTATLVEYDVGHQQPAGVLLFVKRAGAVRYRRFSIAHALSQERGPLPAPLQPPSAGPLDDAALVADPAKLRAASKVLEGRPVKLLPDQEVAFLRAIVPASAVPPPQAAALRARWLGQHGLRLPDSAPYYLSVSACQDDPDAPPALVPACCALSALGLPQVAPGAPGGLSRGAAARRLVAALEASKSLVWGPGGLSQMRGDAEGGGGAPAGPGGAAPAGGTPAVAPAAEFAYSATWAPASALLAGAAASQQPAQPQAQGPSQLLRASVLRGAGGADGATGAGMLLLNLEPLREDGAGGGCGGWGAPCADDGAARGAGGAGGAAGGDDGCSGGGADGDDGSRVDCGQERGSADDQERPERPAGGVAAGGGGGGGRRAQRPSKVTPGQLADLNAFFARKRQEAEEEAAAAAPPKRQRPAPSPPAGAAAAQPRAPPAGSAAQGPRRAALFGAGAKKPAGAGAKAAGKPAAAGPKKAPAAKRPAAAPAAGGEQPAAAAAADGDGGEGAAGGGKLLPAKRAKKGEGAAAKRAPKAVAGEAATAAAGGDAVVEGVPAAPAEGGTGPQPPQGAGAGAGEAPAAEGGAGAAAAAGAADAAPDAAAAKKRAKAPAVDAAAALAKVTAALAAAISAAAGGPPPAGALKGLTAPELQCYMRHHKLTVGGKKADLEARALQHAAAAGGDAAGAAAGGG